jgi:hypothetical protein
MIKLMMIYSGAPGVIRTPDLLVRSHCCARNHRLAALRTFAQECSFSITSPDFRASLNSAAMQGVGILLGIHLAAWQRNTPADLSCQRLPVQPSPVG